MSLLDDLKAKVEAEQTVIDSAIALLNGLSAQIKAASLDSATMQSLADEVSAKTAALAAAVAANTPAAPAPVAPAAPPAAPSAPDAPPAPASPAP